MNKRIIYRNEEGGVSIICPAPEALGRGWTIEDIAKKDVPLGVQYQIVDKDTIETDETFRNAWECDVTPNGININFTKAKDITKERLRIERKPLLEAQDVLFMKAQESGDDTSAIVAEKNRLRDITKLVDSATTTDELKAIKIS